MGLIGHRNYFEKFSLIKNIQLYVDKAGLDIRVFSEGLDLHDPVFEQEMALKKIFGGTEQ